MMMDEVAKSVCNRQIQIGYRYSFFRKCQWWVGLVVCVCGFFFFRGCGVCFFHGMGGVREVLMVRHTYLGGILPTSAVASKL
jgi:hypothetical protein